MTPKPAGFPDLPMPSFNPARLLAFPLVVIALMMLTYGCTNVPVGSGTVVFDRFTHRFTATRGPGLTWVNPISQSKVSYTTRTQTIHFTEDFTMEGPDRPISVLSNDALGLLVDLTVQYDLQLEDLQNLHENIGTDYRNKVVVPMVREIVRDTFAKYEATEAATSARDTIKQAIENQLRPRLATYFVTLEAVLIRDVQLPDQVIQAINAKKAAQQDAEKMQYVLQKSEREKEQVRIEAMAQAERIQIINDALARNPNYLKWLAIDKLNPNVNLVISDGKTILNLDALDRQE